jgi:hypothetical protein
LLLLYDGSSAKTKMRKSFHPNAVQKDPNTARSHHEHNYDLIKIFRPPNPPSTSIMMAPDRFKLSSHTNDGLSQYGGRDLVGYGDQPPRVEWPNGAKVAISLVLNYEEGGEMCLLHGDDRSEHLLSEIVGAVPYEGQRHANMESLYDYGSRAGFWRLNRLFHEKKVPCTVFAVGMALERNPSVVDVLRENVQNHGWEVASHGYRWISYENVDESVESEHIRRTVEIHERLLGKRPSGIYQGKVVKLKLCGKCDCRIKC